MNNKPFKNENNRWQLNIEPTEMITHGSWGSSDIGKHASIMEIWDNENGVPSMIEWDIPSLEETEHIGLTFEDKELVDYDGIMEMPKEAVYFLEQLGYNMDYCKD